MRIALAQINPTVGDISGNAHRITQAIEQAKAKDARLVVFPELAIIGYPPKDLLLKPRAIDQCLAAVQSIAKTCVGITAVVGLPVRSDKPAGRDLHNAAAVCADGKIASVHLKHLLPTYDVFDEQRYFEPGPRIDLSVIDGVKLGISICEDLWNDRDSFTRQLYHDNPVDELAAAGAELFINCSASPYIVRKHAFRLKLMANVAKRHKLPIVYCNQVGGNDELVFDGNSCVIDAQGNIIAHAKDFEEDLLIADLPIGEASDTKPSRIETPKEGLASVYEALVLGLRDYCGKCGFKKIVMGLSGGIDSAVSCAIAVAAIGAENVHGVGMPSRYSSGGSVDDARELAENFGVRFDVIPIEPGHAAMETMLKGLFAELNLNEAGVTEENIQARLRGNLMMSLSNKTGAMLVTTGNKSEMAVGYCTLYGDMCGGFSVLTDVPKTMVYDLARWINDDPESPLRQRFGGVTIPVDTITKPPSAELRPDQTDQDSLPEYEVLDEIVERYVEREESVQDIVEQTGFDAATVQRIARLIDINEYKRKQAAPGLKITGRAFGFGRRMPIAQGYDSTRRLAGDG
jgi:NAD+ synthetase